MFIDPLNEDWVEVLRKRMSAMAPEVNLYLLIDGVFVPGLFRSREFNSIDACGPRLLFDALPGCSEAVRDASPFLVPIKILTPNLINKLTRCSGWPMLSAIETAETIDGLANRFSAWCVIENDGQRFNFRFPDTRRLPRIFEMLSSRQRDEMSGPMRAWSYIARDGNWLHLPVAGNPHSVAANPSLDNAQFAAMVRDSEADEMLSRLYYGGLESTASRSVQYQTVRAALQAAALANLPDEWHMAWCEFTLEQGDQDIGVASLAKWKMMEMADVPDR